MAMSRFLAATSAVHVLADVEPPKDTSKTPVVVAFLGRNDVGDAGYADLLANIQSEAENEDLSVWSVTGADFNAMAKDIADLKGKLQDPKVIYMGHGMKNGGGAAAQDAAKENADGLVLISAFLKRSYRPSMAECAAKWSTQPTHNCPDGKGLPLCPGGYLEDGVHSCDGPATPSPEYPVPSLTIGGGLDGIVRVARIAEAWHTQQATPQHKVALVEGMNHADLLSVNAPDAVVSGDLDSEIGAEKAHQAVAKLVAAFLANPGKSSSPSPESFFQPFVDMFVNQEGSWWWTSNNDERGFSPWAANAQKLMAEPMPEGYDKWETTNEFHMLSDEDGIPPYYRAKHRPNVTVSEGVVHGSTVTQLRYTEVSVTEAAAGENGYNIIKEETCAVLSNLPDDGEDFTSAIEIATKLASRQLAYNRTGTESPESLDDGDRCKTINQAALDLALQSASAEAKARFEQNGRPLVMVADTKPFPPAGPWWIWNYLQYNDKGSQVEVSAWYAFYSLDANPYGAGNHYCKLLSPARALEWIYTDGLRSRAAHSVMV